MLKQSTKNKQYQPCQIMEYEAITTSSRPWQISSHMGMINNETFLVIGEEEKIQIYDIVDKENPKEKYNIYLGKKGDIKNMCFSLESNLFACCIGYQIIIFKLMDNLWIKEKIQMENQETADYIVLRNDNEIIFGGRRGLIYVAKYKDNTWNFDKFGETNSLISLIIGKNELVSVDFEKITIWIEERHKWKKYQHLILDSFCVNASFLGQNLVVANSNMILRFAKSSFNRIFTLRQSIRLYDSVNLFQVRPINSQVISNGKCLYLNLYSDMMLLLMEKDDGNIEIRNHNLDHIFEGIFSKDGQYFITYSLDIPFVILKQK